MNVENIKTDKDADDFVVSHYFSKKGAAIRIGDCNEPQYGFYYKNEVKSFLDSLNWHKWIKKDFNNDNKSDLIYCGCVDNGFKVLAFVSNNNCNYTISELSASSEYYNPNYIKISKDGNFLVVERYNPDNPNWDSTVTYKQMITADTLKYWENNFVDWETEENRNQIKSIELTYRVALAKKIQERKIIITGDGAIRFEKKATLNDTMYKLGLFIYEKKSTDSVYKFLNLVNSLPFAKLDSFYNAPYFDGFDWVIDIKFKDGSSKYIYDHMGVAPYSIRLLYEFAMRRFNDDDWKLIEIKEKW